MGATVTFVGGPRDGEQSTMVSGEPVAVLVVDDSGGVDRYPCGVYFWGAGPARPG